MFKHNKSEKYNYFIIHILFNLHNQEVDLDMMYLMVYENACNPHSYNPGNFTIFKLELFAFSEIN